MRACTRRSLGQAALAAPLLIRANVARAAYPDRPVRLIVPYSAGGVADTIARML